MKVLLIKLIRGYSYLISPLLGRNCRFYPTCSDYTRQAIEKHGAVKGTFAGMRRILKCHPWYHGEMVDSVPDDIAWRDLIGYKRRNAKKTPIKN
jgi:hypothetical protein